MIGTTYLALAAKKSVEIDKALRSQKLTDPTLILISSWLVKSKEDFSASAVAPLAFAEDIRCVMSDETQQQWMSTFSNSCPFCPEGHLDYCGGICGNKRA